MIVQAVKVRDYFETYTWCYLYLDEQTKHGVVIDPGAEPEKILHSIRENGYIIDKILLTHGHFDHTGGVDKISTELQIPYYIHQAGEKYLKDIRYNLSGYCRRRVVLENASYLQDGDYITIGEDSGMQLQVIHTPGHTEDSVVYYDGEHHVAFVGDTIFLGSIGTDEYPGGNKVKLHNSILQKIFSLPDDTVLYCGHSDHTTVGTEKRRYGI